MAGDDDTSHLCINMSGDRTAVHDCEERERKWVHLSVNRRHDPPGNSLAFTSVEYSRQATPAARQAAAAASNAAHADIPSNKKRLKQQRIQPASSQPSHSTNQTYQVNDQQLNQSINDPTNHTNQIQQSHQSIDQPSNQQHNNADGANSEEESDDREHGDEDNLPQLVKRRKHNGPNISLPDQVRGAIWHATTQPGSTTPSAKAIADQINQEFPELDVPVTDTQVRTTQRAFRAGKQHRQPKRGKQAEYKVSPHYESIWKYQEDNPLCAYAEIRAHCQIDYPNLSFGDDIICKALAGHERPFTTKRTYISDVDTNTRAMIGLRARYCKDRMEAVNWDDIVFVDEAGFDIYTLPGRGRSHIGQRIRVDAPPSPGPRLNMLVGISGRGIIHFVARYGSTDRSVYIRFLTSLKTHALDLFTSIHVTIMQDGASIQKGEDVKDAVETGSARERACFRDTLPPHSSQLNPCEEFWSRLKSKIRRVNAAHASERLQAREERKQDRKREKQLRSQSTSRSRRRPSGSASSAASVSEINEADESSAAVRETELAIGKKDLLTTVNEVVEEIKKDHTLATSLCQSYLNHARRIWLDCVQSVPLIQ